MTLTKSGGTLAIKDGGVDTAQIKNDSVTIDDINRTTIPCLTSAGKIAGLNSTYLYSVDGSSLTNINQVTKFNDASLTDATEYLTTNNNYETKKTFTFTAPQDCIIVGYKIKTDYKLAVGSGVARIRINVNSLNVCETSMTNNDGDYHADRISAFARDTPVMALLKLSGQTLTIAFQMQCTGAESNYIKNLNVYVYYLALPT